jgi:hypothetical protein
MNLSSKEKIEAPIDAVFDMVTDFAAFEARARDSGVQLRRTDRMENKGPGMMWDAAFELHGKLRQFDLTLATFDPPTHFSVTGLSDVATGVFHVELLALSRQRTRLTVVLDVMPRTTSGRLLIHALRLARTRLMKRFKLRVAEYAREMEERYRRGA